MKVGATSDESEIIFIVGQVKVGYITNQKERILRIGTVLLCGRYHFRFYINRGDRKTFFNYAAGNGSDCAHQAQDFPTVFFGESGIKIAYLRTLVSFQVPDNGMPGIVASFITHPALLLRK
jgi:hypothetical protein